MGANAEYMYSAKSEKQRNDFLTPAPTPIFPIFRLENLNHISSFKDYKIY